jgi:hypothetical protein
MEILDFVTPAGRAMASLIGVPFGWNRKREFHLEKLGSRERGKEGKKN